jgi:microcystin-dependent protein
MQRRQGPSFSLHYLGATGGSETATLLESETLAHDHAINKSNDDGNNTNPTERYFGRGNAQYGAPNDLGTMALQMLAWAGSDAPHNNLQPYLTFNFCIALQEVSLPVVEPPRK